MTECSPEETMKDQTRGNAEDTQPSEREQEQARYAQSKAKQEAWLKTIRGSSGQGR